MSITDSKDVEWIALFFGCVWVLQMKTEPNIFAHEWKSFLLRCKKKTQSKDFFNNITQQTDFLISILSTWLHSKQQGFFLPLCQFFLKTEVHKDRHIVTHSKSKYRPAASTPPGPIQLWSCLARLVFVFHKKWVCALPLMSQNPPGNLLSAVLLTTSMLLLCHLYPTVSLATSELVSPLFSYSAAVHFS